MSLKRWRRSITRDELSAEYLDGHSSYQVKLSAWIGESDRKAEKQITGATYAWTKRSNCQCGSILYQRDNMLMRILYWLDMLNEYIGRIVSWAIWVGAAVLVYEVIMRYAFDSPTAWAHGYTQRIFGSYFILLGTFTLLRRGHVRIDIFLSEEGTRVRAIQDIFNYGMLLIWMLALSYEGWAFLQESILWGEVDESGLGHPLWPPKLMLFVGSTLMAVQAAVEILHCLTIVLFKNMNIKRGVISNGGF